tara:strand:- start:6520 stop:6921 length:402 start_codon:yes stop_codon:yes gene_type:complete
MTVHIPVSFGELIDKLTILKIKSEKITDIKKIKFIDIEFYSLNQVYLKYYKMMDKHIIENINTLYNDLYNINNKLWIIEDNIRDKERNKEFDNDFIDIARSVYITNDKRMSIKKSIDKLMGSDISEQKSYKPY